MTGRRAVVREGKGDQGVLLSAESVHIYTDPDASTPSASAAPAFERERRLKDVTADGVNIFHTSQPSAVQLGEDVRRLWAERGDFLQFDAHALSQKVERRTRKRKLARTRHADGAEQSGTGSSDDDGSSSSDDESRDKNDVEDKAATSSSRDAVISGTIKESEFIALRDKVLSNLDVAHFNSIHAHQLLGMLIRAHKPVNTVGTGAGRGSTPAPSVGAGSAKSTSARPALAPLGIFADLAPTSAKEDDFILDPLALSLSRTALNTAVSSRRDTTGADEEDGDSDDELVPSDPAFGITQAKKELEESASYKQDRLRDFKISLATKRDALRSAADLLQAGADELRSCQSSERERWRGLIGLRNRGWGFTPGRPLLDMERFGAPAADENAVDQTAKNAAKSDPSEDDKADKPKETKSKPKAGAAASLQGFGTPVLAADGKIREEGARDAWIGFGLPEAPIELRRRTLAYWTDTTASETSSTSASDRLIIPDRPGRRLCVNLVLWPSNPSDNKKVWTSDRASPPSDFSGDALPLVQLLDEDLQQASQEATDELVFGDIVAQARQLAPAFGVRLTPTSARVILTPKLDLVFELVPKQTEHSPDESQPEHSPFASLILAFLRSSPLRKWNAFASAIVEARAGDSSAKAAATRASSQPTPRRPQSASLHGNSDAATKADKGSKDRADSNNLPKGDSLAPILVSLHYWSFISRLRGLLQAVQQKMNVDTERCRIDLVPLTAPLVDQSSAFLSALMEATSVATGPRTPDLHAPAQQSTSSNTPAPTSALSGHAKVWIDGHLICTLDLSQPSELTARFQARVRDGGASDASSAVGAGRPLQLDLATLDELLRRQISRSL